MVFEVVGDTVLCDRNMVASKKMEKGGDRSTLWIINTSRSRTIVDVWIYYASTSAE